MKKDEIINAIRALARDRDLDPQGRYDMLGEIGSVLDHESDTIYAENDIDDSDEWESVDDFDDDFDDDDFDDDFDDDDFDDDFDDDANDDFYEFTDDELGIDP